MRKSLDQLARNLASGMSRRKAIWQFVGGLGVVAALTGRKAYAGIGRIARTSVKSRPKSSRVCVSGFGVCAVAVTAPSLR